MKKLIPVIILAAFTVLGLSCKKSTPPVTAPAYTCTACKTTPEAVAANDASSKGIYKGVLIGSTGTVKFDISNSGSTITATLVIDGVTTTLTSTVAWVSGVAYVAPFTGTLNGSAVSITFSVSAGGGSPTITSASVPGHAGISFTMIKETSTALISAYEGTYSTTKPETGTFNIIVSRSLSVWGGVARANGSTSVSNIGGRISGNDLIDTQSSSNMGTLNGDVINGKFTDSNNVVITVTGKRTL